MGKEWDKNLRGSIPGSTDSFEMNGILLRQTHYCKNCLVENEMDYLLGYSLVVTIDSQVENAQIHHL